MSTIVWSTPSNLGNQPQGVAIPTINLTAVSVTGGTLTYRVISGQLPAGLSLSTSGQLTGTPIDNQSYKFVVRATRTLPNNIVISDRTFSMAVIGHPPVAVPVIVLPDQFDVVNFSYQVVATDIDPQNKLTYRLVQGNLPRALALSSTGLISGTIVIQPPANYVFTVEISDGTYRINQQVQLNIKNRASGTTVAPIIINQASNIGTFRVDDQFSYKVIGSLDGKANTNGLTYSIVSGTLPPGLTLRTNSGWIDGFLSAGSYATNNKVTYTFAIKATNAGVDSNPKTFSITIDTISDNAEGSNWNVKSELGSILLGQVSKFDVNPHNSKITTFRIKPAVNLITSNSDAFDGGAWTGYCGGTSNVTYNTTDIAAPNGAFTATKLVRDSNTACGGGTAWGLYWGTGNVTVGVTYTISMWVIAPIAINGCLFGFNDSWGSTFNITTAWTRITYTSTLTDPGNGLRGFQFVMPAGSGTAYFWGAQLETGSIATPYASWLTGTPNPALPPNLNLEYDGTITGRVSFFNTLSTVTSPLGVYNFEVEMLNQYNSVVATKKFTIRTLYQAPYDAVYLMAFPRSTQRSLVIDLLNNSQIIPREVVYRIEDKNFGIVPNFKMLFLSGLNPVGGDQYIVAMVRNFQRKVSYIRSFGRAVAKNIVTNLPIYEVIYAVLEDSKQDVPEVIRLRRPNLPKLKANNTQINASYGSIVTADQESIVNVYPNSFKNMRQILNNKIDFTTKESLPEWMTTLQDDGTTVGYSNVVPLVYVQPGHGVEVLKNIVASKELFNTVPFDVDGLVWDCTNVPNSSPGGNNSKYLAFPRTGISEYSK